MVTKKGGPMAVDVRTRSSAGVRSLARDELIDGVLRDAVDLHGELAARGLSVLGPPPLGIDVDGLPVSLVPEAGGLAIRPGTDGAGVVGVVDASALSDLVQDVQSPMGLAMTERVRITVGSLNDWLAWEPVLRALFDGRPVHEPGDVTFVDRDGGPLELGRTFAPDDDRETMRQFLEEAGFLHLRGVFEPAEMAALDSEVAAWMERARPDDGESWWATDTRGSELPVRVLFFYDKSALLRELVADDRFSWLAGLTGDGHRHDGGAEALVKPLGIVRGLSDLPWHKDCGQGGHSFRCNSLTCGISVTGANRSSGALGVVPGSHRANTMAATRDRRLDLAPRLLETETGDITLHCSDTLHRAHPPVDRPRTVVYTDFVLPPLAGVVEPPASVAPSERRAARARLTDAQTRIEAADNPANPDRYRAHLGG
jgi:Phytanoyl-CoA dioxygenase (PhyH)